MVRQKSISQLRREVAQQRKRISKQQVLSESIKERQILSKELFELKNRRLIELGGKAKRLSRKFGRGILRTGKKIAPILKKQARLIRDQQLRDDAISKRLSGKSKKIIGTPVKKRRKSRRKSSKRKSPRR